MNFFKTMIAAALGFMLTIVVVFIFFFVVIGIAMAGGKSTPEVAKNSVLELKIGIDVADRNAAENPFAALSGEDDAPVGLTEILYGIDKAMKDDKIKGLYLRADFYEGGFANAREIRNKIIEFRKSGKFALAYAETLSQKAYYIASACDSVFLNPTGFAELNGLSAGIVMYKGMLDKAGVQFQVFKAGKYKGAVEPFVNTELSAENRQQITDYINDVSLTMINEVAVSRRINKDTAQSIYKNFKCYNGKLAVKHGMIDNLLYEDEVLDKLKLKAKNTQDEFEVVKFGDYVAQGLEMGNGDDKIAVIYANGEIGMGKNEDGENIGSETLVEEIRKVRKNENIKAVVLRVNSPGGSSNASDIIAREIILLKKAKPVIVSFGNVAASGGYYIAALGDSIFAQPNTITGSIGVFALMVNAKSLYENKLGLGYETVSTGEYAPFFRPDNGLNEKQQFVVQSMVDNIYNDFLTIVSKGRKMDKSIVHELAQGHVYTANKAINLKLVDKLGGLQRAIQSAAYKAKLKKYTVVRSAPPSIFSKFLGGEVQSKVAIKYPAAIETFLHEVKNIQWMLKPGLSTYMRMPSEYGL